MDQHYDKNARSAFLARSLLYASILTAPNMTSIPLLPACAPPLSGCTLSRHTAFLSTHPSPSSSSSILFLFFPDLPEDSDGSRSIPLSSPSSSSSIPTLHTFPSTVTSASAPMRTLTLSSLTPVLPGLTGRLATPAPRSIIIRPRGCVMGKFILFAMTENRLVMRAKVCRWNIARPTLAGADEEAAGAIDRYVDSAPDTSSNRLYDSPSTYGR